MCPDFTTEFLLSKFGLSCNVECTLWVVMYAKHSRITKDLVGPTMEKL